MEVPPIIRATLYIHQRIQVAVNPSHAQLPTRIPKAKVSAMETGDVALTMRRGTFLPGIDRFGRGTATDGVGWSCCPRVQCRGGNVNSFLLSRRPVVTVNRPRGIRGVETSIFALRALKSAPDGRTTRTRLFPKPMRNTYLNRGRDLIKEPLTGHLDDLRV